MGTDCMDRVFMFQYGCGRHCADLAQSRPPALLTPAGFSLVNRKRSPGSVSPSERRGATGPGPHKSKRALVPGAGRARVSGGPGLLTCERFRLIEGRRTKNSRLTGDRRKKWRWNNEALNHDPPQTDETLYVLPTYPSRHPHTRVAGARVYALHYTQVDGSMAIEKDWPDFFGEKKVEHSPSCPVAQPDYRLPTTPDGFVDTTKPSQCNCGFMKRLQEGLGL